MKKNTEVQTLILEQLTRLEAKLDKITEEKLPGILIDVAKLNERTASDAKITSLIGGGLAVITSAIIAWARK